MYRTSLPWCEHSKLRQLRNAGAYLRYEHGRMVRLGSVPEWRALFSRLDRNLPIGRDANVFELVPMGHTVCVPVRSARVQWRLHPAHCRQLCEL